ncbi:MAG: right-handed parallel beta-helix repeat-containing protein [Planctomycetota bacterium]|nr:MAG: right-handed parallel beta-helix repeat-containing protein [Planctomycetota bacterium]
MRLPPFVLSSLLAFWIATPLVAQTNVSGNQSGIWDLAGSPYHLVGDVTVPPGASLQIEPGVEIIGQGQYKITVDLGATLTATGTASLPIHFYAQDPLVGWRGLRFQTSSDQSLMQHCIVEHAIGSGAWPDVRGGAVMVFDCSPTFADSEFRFNSSSNANRNGFGGGIGLENSSAVIERCWFHDNEADSGGGIATSEWGTPEIRNNLVTDNSALGNGGGGMYFGARSTPIVEGNIVMRNEAGYWGGGGMNSWTSYIFYFTFPTIRNNLIVFNSSLTDGGGLYLRYDAAVVTNNLIAFNDAQTGGAIYVVNQGFSEPQVSNSILWGNQSAVGANIELYPGLGGSIAIQYSDVEGGWPGVGNIDADPGFRDPLGLDGIAGTDDDDYRLMGFSSCVDAGHNSSLPPSVTTDLAGMPRWVDHPGTPDTGLGGPPTIDLGPFELQVPVLGGPTPGTVNTQNSWSLSGATPNGAAQFAYGLTSGNLPVPGCPSVISGLGQAALFGTTTAGSDGTVAVSAFVPASASGRLIYFQALDVNTCRLSEVRTHVFP